MNDIMIDLETLGTRENAVVVSIGACLFDVETGKVGVTFYMVLDLQDQLNNGRKIDADTLKWWFQQEDAAKKVFHDKAKPVTEVLAAFSWWVKSNSHKKVKVWGNGSLFDIGIMEHLYKMYFSEIPWTFNNVMDLRTFKRFVGKGAQIDKKGVAHNALDDAISQAEYVIKHSKTVTA